MTEGYFLRSSAKKRMADNMNNFLILPYGMDRSPRENSKRNKKLFFPDNDSNGNSKKEKRYFLHTNEVSHSLEERKISIYLGLMFLILCAILPFIMFFIQGDASNQVCSVLKESQNQMNTHIMSFRSNLPSLKESINSKKKLQDLNKKETLKDFARDNDIADIRQLQSKQPRLSPLCYGCKDQTKLEEQVEEIAVKDLDHRKETKTHTLFHFADSVPDYALKSMGAKIIETIDTEPHGDQYVMFNLFGIVHLPLYFDTDHFNGPSQILQPWSSPGECWAFKGSRGTVRLKLSHSINIIAVSMEHIVQSLSPELNIDSAPRLFSIIGSEKSDSTIKLKHLGTFEYEKNGPYVQTFQVKSTKDVFYDEIELRILSNHGNANLTCVYKLRVHGQPFLGYV